jgi:hypothetical protein
MDKQKISQIIFGITGITWFVYVFLSPFLRLIFEFYASLLFIIEYILIAEYVCIAIIMIDFLRDSLWAYHFNMRLKEQWQQTPEGFLLQDVSAESKEFKFPIALEYKKQVERLGFRRLGETENIYVVNYVFTNEDNSVIAVVRPRKPDYTDVFFETVFADNFTLITGYTRLLNIVVDGLQQQTVNYSLEKAHNYHLHQLELERLQRGQPVPISTIEQTIQHAQEHNKRYIDLEIRAALRVCMFMLLFGSLIEMALPIGIYGLLNSDSILASFPIGILTLLIYLATKFIPELQPVENHKPKRKRKVYFR